MSRRAADVKRRWDIDEIGHGIASGRAFTPDVQRLEAALELPDWIAEQPEAHLLPHIRRVVESPESPYDLALWEIVDDVLVVDLVRKRPGIRGDDMEVVLAIVGGFAEPATHIRQRRIGDSFEYDIATGVLEGDSVFAPHGHLVRLRVRPKAG